MPDLYYIKDWQTLYETYETRKLASLNWWPKPNKHDGLGFRRMCAERDKVQLFCAWNLIGDIASKTTPKERRGYLERDSKPLDAGDMAIMTGFPIDIFTRALDFFGSSSVGWLCKESAGSTGGHAGRTGKSPDVQKGMEGKEEKENPAPDGGGGRGDPLEVPDKLKTQEFMNAWARWQTFRRGMKRVKDWQGLFREQLDHLATFDAPTATEMLKQSIRNGWQGLFPIKGVPAAQASTTGPTLATVHALAKEKYGDDPNHGRWAASFHGHWSDPKRAWKRNGKSIDWQVEFSQQVARWRERK